MSRPRSRDAQNDLRARRLGIAAAALFAGVPGLLQRMKRDLDQQSELRRATAVLMWSAYGAAGAICVADLAAPDAAPRSASLARAGAACAAVGAALMSAGMRRFAGPSQLTGTEAGDLVTGGAYRYSRNPQYTGLIAFTAGLAVARSAPIAGVMAGALAATLHRWVRTEEQHLERHFGAAYRRYQAATPRWLGRPSSG